MARKIYPRLFIIVLEKSVFKVYTIVKITTLVNQYVLSNFILE